MEKFATVVVRTDFSDDQGWLATLAMLKQAPDGSKDHEAEMVVVDDPFWSGATPDEVLDYARRDPYLAGFPVLVVLVDEETVAAEEHPVLVVCADNPAGELCGEVGPASRELRSIPREVHAIPREVHAISATIGVADTGFEKRPPSPRNQEAHGTAFIARDLQTFAMGAGAHDHHRTDAGTVSPPAFRP